MKITSFHGIGNWLLWACAPYNVHKYRAHIHMQMVVTSFCDQIKSTKLRINFREPFLRIYFQVGMCFILSIICSFERMLESKEEKNKKCHVWRLFTEQSNSNTIHKCTCSVFVNSMVLNKEHSYSFDSIRMRRTRT